MLRVECRAGVALNEEGIFAVLVSHPLVSGVVGGVVATLIGAWISAHRSYDRWREDLARPEPYFRKLASARLQATEWGRLYSTLLDGAIRRADGLFGPPLSQRAFATCVVIALIYAYVGFWICYALGASARLGSADFGLPESNTVRAVVSAVVLTILPVAYVLGGREGRVQRLRKIERDFLKKNWSLRKQIKFFTHSKTCLFICFLIITKMCGFLIFYLQIVPESPFKILFGVFFMRQIGRAHV